MSGILHKLHKPTQTKKCATCGELFTRHACRLAKYCSPKCHTASQVRLPDQACEHCARSFKPYNSRKRRFCSKECQHKHTVGSQHSLWRGNRRQERGPTWTANAKAARERDKVCVAIGCGKDHVELGQKLSVDHIVPFRLTAKYGASEGVDPNHLDNLACLCRGHHSMKTRAEARLLKGDMIGFLTTVRALLPMDRIEKALTMWGLGRNIEMMHQKGIKPEDL